MSGTLCSKQEQLKTSVMLPVSNRTGTDGNGIRYCGDSAIIHPYGDSIIAGNSDRECTITGEISIPFLSEFRKKFPVMKDADDFSIHNLTLLPFSFNHEVHTVLKSLCLVSFKRIRQNLNRMQCNFSCAILNMMSAACSGCGNN